jgi:predicted ATPase
MKFKVGEPKFLVEETIIYLRPNTRWNDYSFVTEFHAVAVGNKVNKALGEVKIGFLGQDEDEPTYSIIDEGFEVLPPVFFSLGQNPEYYENIRKVFGDVESEEYLLAMRDVAYDENIFENAYREKVFTESISRFVSISTIKGQFKEVISTGVSLDSYGFVYTHENGECIDFKVSPSSRPPTNVHALIGINGVGKSYILVTIAKHIDKKSKNLKKLNGDHISAYDFGQLVYFSLGVFGDPTQKVDFNDSKLRIDRTKKKYIGIYNQKTGKLKDVLTEMAGEFADSVYNCLHGSEIRRGKLLRALELLGVDVDFQTIELEELAELNPKEEIKFKANSIFSSLSSGHASVLYYITSIVEVIEDKTIFLFDEPENHLHPPLLAAFIRTLSNLLSESNGIAIIATHSPVVVQEIPRSCVWKVGSQGIFSRPNIETFGESIGDITSEVFSLDMRKSGFYSLLEGDAKRLVFKEVVELYKGQIGSEGRAIVAAHAQKAIK